jgi:hypothetical protein
MSFLYLEALNENHNLHALESIYKEGQTKYRKTLDTIAKASIVLKNVKHAIFKTVRPYRSTTVDIDIIIFGNKNDQRESLRTMLKAGFELVTCGPMSVTLLDKEANIGIDLYEEVAVSFITYIDKSKLITCVTNRKLPNGEFVKMLKPEADLACIIAHSIMKEQMYTLSEYYTFIHYLKQMDIQGFVKIAKENNIVSVARTHTSITALLHKMAHGNVPYELQQILNNLGKDQFETTRLIKNNFETPHKYHTMTVVKSLLEIAKGKKSRKSMAMQIYQMSHPNFTKKFLKVLMEHVIRETY